MKFLCIFVLCLVASANAYRSVTHQKIDKLYSTKGWSSTILKMAEMHMLVKGPVEDLVAAIDDVTEDLNTKLQTAHTNYEIRSNQHDETVARLTASINKAKSDIVSANDSLEQVLYPLVAHLKLSIANDQQLIVDTKAAMVNATTVRGQEHEEFGAKIASLQEAIDVLQECVDVLQQLLNGELVQVKATQVLNKAHHTLSKFKSTDVALAKVLAQVAMNQEFTDQTALRRVFNMIADTQSNLKQSQVELTLEEKLAQQTFEEFIADSKTAINNASSRIASNTDMLQKTLQNIADTLDYIKQRQADQAGFEQDLVDENVAFELATKMYNELVEQLEKELAGVALAKQIVTSGEFAGYIGDRINAQGTVPMQQQGSGVEVFQGYSDVV